MKPVLLASNTGLDDCIARLPGSSRHNAAGQLALLTRGRRANRTPRGLPHRDARRGQRSTYLSDWPTGRDRKPLRDSGWLHPAIVDICPFIVLETGPS